MAPVDFGKGEAFRDTIWRSFTNPRYREELLDYCVRTGVIQPERVEHFLNNIERDAASVPVYPELFSVIKPTEVWCWRAY